MTAPALDAIVLFGDSLTQGGWEPYGFAQRLAYVYARKLDVINRGLSGYNTEWAIPVFEQSFARHETAHLYPKTKLLLIWFGANDACLTQSPQHVPLDKFQSNLEHIISLIRNPDSTFYSPSTRLALLTPPPIDEDVRAAELAARDPPIAPDRLFKVTKEYADCVKALGIKAGLPVVDVWDAVWTSADQDMKNLHKFLSDGLHLTPAGYEIVYDKIMLMIKEDFPELHYDKLPQVFAHWSDIDWKNPKPSLRSRRLEEL